MAGKPPTLLKATSNSMVPFWNRVPLSHAAPSRMKSALRPRYGSTRTSAAWMSQADESNGCCAGEGEARSNASSAAAAPREVSLTILDGTVTSAAAIERFGHQTLQALKL